MLKNTEFLPQKTINIREECRNDTTPRVDIKVTGYTLVETNEESLRQAVGKFS